MSDFRPFSLAEAAQGASVLQNVQNNALAMAAARDKQARLSPLMAAAASGDQSAAREVVGIDPELGNQILTATSKMDENQREQFKYSVDTKGSVLQAVMNVPEVYRDQAWESAKEELIGALGPDATKGMPERFDPNWTQMNIDKAMSVSDLLSARGNMFQPTPVYDKSGKLVLMQASNVPGKAPTILEGVTPVDKVDSALRVAEGKADIEVDQAAAEVAAKGGAERYQESIDIGLAASQGIPTLKRTMDLLEEVETGGIQNARLKSKQLFGIEGADEGELSYNLGKSVLSQLRTTFGAQFTEKEGQRLNEIEAGFGKSPATNKRLIGQLLKVAEDKAKRAIRKAKAAGDMETAQEIEDLMNFQLAEEKPAKEAKPATITTSGKSKYQIEVLP